MLQWRWTGDVISGVQMQGLVVAASIGHEPESWALDVNFFFLKT